MQKLKVTGCTISCAYALGSEAACTCPCGGKFHGIMADKPQPPRKCSPAAEKRCKSGEEHGACTCACGGDNHAIYRHIHDFEQTVRITHYA